MWQALYNNIPAEGDDHQVASKAATTCLLDKELVYKHLFYSIARQDVGICLIAEVQQ